MLLPEGFRKDLAEDLEMLSQRFEVSIVAIDGVDWNNDLTPWPAPGVFKKAKPFGGQAAAFLIRLTETMIAEIETGIGLRDAERTLLGVSLSGLFAVWAGFNSDLFQNLIGISSSLWYDGFTEWMEGKRLFPVINKVCLLLGNREKNSKEHRMATVEEKTRTAARILNESHTAEIHFELVEGTHFSPILPRIEQAFDVIYSCVM